MYKEYKESLGSLRLINYILETVSSILTIITTPTGQAPSIRPCLSLLWHQVSVCFLYTPEVNLPGSLAYI